MGTIIDVEVRFLVFGRFFADNRELPNQRPPFCIRNSSLSSWSVIRIRRW